MSDTPRKDALQFDCNDGIAHSIERMVVDANDYAILERELVALEAKHKELRELAKAACEEKAHSLYNLRAAIGEE